MNFITLFLVFAAATTADAHTMKKSPIAKIVQMLSDMQAKGKTEKQEEQVRYASFEQFCKSTGGEKARSIAKGKEQLEQLGAAIAKAEADASVLGKEVTQHEGDVVTWKGELKKAQEERKKEHAAFNEAHKEYTASIDSVERALAHLEKNLPGAASLAQTSSVFALLQVNGQKMPQKARKVLMSFLQIHDPDMARKAKEALLQEAAEEGVDVAPPEVATYESSSGGIVEMIEQLGSKFEDERMELEKREANAKNAFVMMSKDLTSSVMEAEMMIGSKKSTKATRLEDAAEAKGDLADTDASVKEDEKFLADLNAECEQKKFDFEQRQIVRSGEIEAIGKAIEIMSSPEVAGGAAHTMLTQGQISWVPPVGFTSLAQLRSTDQSSKQEDVAQFLEQRSKMLNSRLLSLIAQRASADPFKKVKKMCQDMISKLMEEANEAADHKAFCDAEMSTNKQTRDSKASEAEGLKADIEGFTADIAKLAEEITDLADQIGAIDAAVAKAPSDRQDEKSKNTATVKDAEVANAAVTQAIQILKDFYEQAATPVEQPAPIKGPIKWDPRAIQLLAPSFIQTGSSNQGQAPGAPEMEEGAYTGMGNGGVLGLMEVCQSDMEKVISETTATETEAAKIYDQFMADSDQDKAVKSADQGHKNTGKSGKESKLATAHKDLRITEEELTAAMAYYEKLRPSCEEKVMSYEEKVAQRKAEIESLKEALEILSP